MMEEVKVFDASGSEVTFAEGSFVLWDGCAACATAVKVDFSGMCLQSSTLFNPRPLRVNSSFLRECL